MVHHILTRRWSLLGAANAVLAPHHCGRVRPGAGAAVVEAQTAAEPKPASPFTLEFNKNSTASLPWSDKADFVNAKRGLIAPLPEAA